MAQTLASRTLSIGIDRDWREVYEFTHQPRNFPRWASGLADSLKQQGDHWIATAPEGQVKVWFTPRNDYGVLDHRVELPGGVVAYVPLRVIENGPGAEVLLTLFRLPDMDDATFSRDAKWVAKDLAALKGLLERKR
ncbi:SRPBCC family protein [Solimonas sp. K1W22B-7]|uniref:SRPBCC family protein n=1 Tax=Solimonas sp. K1W22B-7 TaxID=2303331 RepID=UPI000E33019F|nr:SRPBCC family protein [Solimonas sp. K1W22B-7]AXQ31768.1 SRPBCC family protein [Solimonas sp. K1W22B-7]